MSDFVLSLGDPEATLESVGSKGVNLSRLVRAGFPVPPGFVITTAAYRAFARLNDLETQIAELSPSSVTREAIHSLFETSPIPEPISDAILRGYDDLRQFIHPQSPPPVAVRSSAMSQDLPVTGPIDQQEAYLNVRGAESLLRAVKRCWANLSTAYIIAHRTQAGTVASSDSSTGTHPSASAIALSVVVQRMVPAEAAGVLFTANPLTGDRNEAVIHAAWGLGEAVVGGQVTPDTIVVDKATSQVLKVHIGNKTVMTAPISDGTIALPVPNSQRQKAVLTHAQVKELIRLGHEIEALFDSPQDIEWAIAAGQTVILQARPVIGLPEAPSVPKDHNGSITQEYPAAASGSSFHPLRFLRRLPIFRLILDRTKTGKE